MKTLILNYYKNTVLVNNAKDAINFINSLPNITANDSTRTNLDSYFLGKNSYMNSTLEKDIAYDIATTGCGLNRIKCYRPLAETLEEHNTIVLERRKNKEAEEAEQRKKREQDHLEMMYEYLKGWYVVTLTGLACKERGNDGKVTKSVRVLAENRMSAYNKTIAYLEENRPKNVIFWYIFEGSNSALFEFVGVWTDKDELEFCSN